MANVVTIAALHGAGGSVIGSRVAQRLGVPFFDRPAPTPDARAAPGVDPEEPRSRWDEVVDAVGRAAPPTSASGHLERIELEQLDVRREVEEFLAEAGAHGGVVVGRAGAVVLASAPGALHVYLGGSSEGRVKRVMEREGLDRESASREVDVHDRARRYYVKTAYGVDGDDPALYHLVIDTVSLGNDVCVQLIVTASEAMGRAGDVAGST